MNTNIEWYLKKELSENKNSRNPKFEAIKNDKISGQKLKKKQYLHSLKISNTFTSYKEKSSNFIMKITGKHHFS